MNENEGFVFLGCIFFGFFSGALFDFFKVIRKSFKGNIRLTDICDGLFWTAYTIIFLSYIFNANDGELRWFVFGGISLGWAVYLLLLSTLFTKIGMVVFSLIKAILVFAVKILMFPPALFLRITKRACIIIVAPVRKLNKKAGQLKRFFKRKARTREFCAKKI